MVGEVLKLNFYAIKTYFLEMYAFPSNLSFLMNIYEADSQYIYFFFAIELIFNFIIVGKDKNTNITKLNWPA